MSRHPARRAMLAITILGILGSQGCGRRPEAPTRLSWCFGREPGDLRPWSRHDPYTVALRRLLYRGLVDQDTAGRIVPAAAQSWESSPDSLVWTFRLRPGLQFADGEACVSADFRRAILAALRSESAGAAQWLLWDIAGVERFRGRSTDTLAGVETPAPDLVRLRLARRDPWLLAKLAHPLLAAPTSPRATVADSLAPAGLGPYRVIEHQPGRRLVLLGGRRNGLAARFDTLAVDFTINLRRVRSGMREGRYDLVWPLPANLPDQPAPETYALGRSRAAPASWLLLAFRCDLPPTTRPEARRALAAGLNRPGLLRQLGILAEGGTGWLDGLPLALPSYDREEVRSLLARRDLGPALHVLLGYARGGAGDRLARVLQPEWAALALDAERAPLGPAALSRALAGGGPHVMLAEEQPLLDSPSARMAVLLRGPRGRGAGGVRVSWPGLGFDEAVWPRRGRMPLDLASARRAIEEELPVVPLARLPHVWLARQGGPEVGFHPRFGPGLDFADSLAIRAVSRDGH